MMPATHDEIIKWKHFPRYRWPVNSLHKGQWRGALIFFFICTLNKRFNKQSWSWWFEMPSHSLWCHCNTGRTSGTLMIIFGGIYVRTKAWIVTIIGSYYLRLMHNIQNSITSALSHKNDSHCHKSLVLPVILLNKSHPSSPRHIST